MGVSFVDYLKHYFNTWPNIKNRSFDAHLREYFSEWPEFTADWRCCNGGPCERPGLYDGRDSLGKEELKLAHRIETRMRPAS
jgi:hypothetical protein